MGIMLSGLVVSIFFLALLIPYKLEYKSLLIFFIGASGFFLYGPYSMTSGCLVLDLTGPKKAGTCTGLLDGVGYAGSASALFLVGWLSDASGWSYVFYLLTILAIASVVSCYQMSRIFRKEQKKTKTTLTLPLKTVCQ